MLQHKHLVYIFCSSAKMQSEQILSSVRRQKMGRVSKPYAQTYTSHMCNIARTHAHTHTRTHTRTHSINYHYVYSDSMQCEW